ncbi:GNAT family N-acetyltransferase [Massilia sp. BJB1822]|uniref:GNAT family N-acetyltransferase n=1 Tax=Massilia sp. BJB1822 TaxID=2744470 RepID=UPI00159448EF|nr:GNAT family protein [Massilia sp. BJB1822]NVD99387.1 GNAT family N-acetyltransferase [Massilia sp. BJB1822]
MLISCANPELHTPRLLLRKFAASDFDAFRAYHCLPEVYRFLYNDPPEGEAMRACFETVRTAPFAADGDKLTLAVCRREDGAVVGEVLLKLGSTAALQGELGYLFNPAFHGQGLALEAARAMLDFGFAELGFHRIFARLDSLNTASARIAEKLGMQREAHLRQNDRHKGVWGDEFIYALLRSEWDAK